MSLRSGLAWQSALRSGLRGPILALGISLMATGGACGQPGGVPLRYQSPLPGAELILPHTTIILRPPGHVDPSTLPSPGQITIVGSLSGAHGGSAILSDDGSTLVIKPATPLEYGETVSFELAPGLRTLEQGELAPISFSFHIQDSAPASAPSHLRELAELGDGEASSSATTVAADTLPFDFPHMTITMPGTPAPGRLFLSNLRFGGTFVPYLMILDNSGEPIFYRKMNAACLDFKRQPYGLLTYFDRSRNSYFVMDSSYAEIDSLRCGNGYATDKHELLLMLNGHALLMSYDPQSIDMSAIVPGGDPVATVYGLVVQELDLAKNVVFQWRSWDAFEITDATAENLTAPEIDYVHGNAIELDTDGGLLVSCRHMDEITKISRDTGEIVWRLGGEKNQFAFVNDPIGFSHQHAIRRLPSGNVTLFDNGNGHMPPASRAVEYSLDEANKVATQVWEYHHTPEIFSFAMGYVQRLDNGNTPIGWGASNTTLTEVQPDGTPVFELKFDPEMFSYRAFRYDWAPELVSASAGPQAIRPLSQNDPNPFRGKTRVLLSFSRPAHPHLAIYDVAGRAVRTILQGEARPPGSHPVTIDAAGLRPGIYFYRLASEEGVDIRKMVLLGG